MSQPSFHIQSVRSAAELEATAALFEAYASSVGVDLAYQDFAAELAALPGKYAPPAGELLLARRLPGNPLGCVGLRPLAGIDDCEMKRLYVAPEGRGLGVGRALMDAIIQEARRIGYAGIRLDTLPSMTEAISLYQSAGFSPIEPYYYTPVAGTRFLGLSLTSRG